MTQEIIFEPPPIFDEIDAVFHVKHKPVIYAWGPVIYNPQRVDIPPQLLAHEHVHGQRQGTNEQKIIDWWHRYINSPKFRLAEELPAHRAEFEWLIEMGNRQQRRKALKQTAQRLASPLYGGLVTPAKAQAMLMDELEQIRSPQ